MSKYSKDDIVQKAYEIASMIGKTDEVDFFKRAESQINKNEKVQQYMKRIKLLQKESVNLQHYQKHEAYQKNEEAIDKLMKELDDLPIVREFKQSQNEVNDLLQLVSTTVSNRVTDQVVKETDGDQLTGQTGSALKNGSDGC